MSVILVYHRYGKEGSEEHPSTEAAMEAAAEAVEHGDYTPQEVRNVYGTVLVTKEEMHRQVYWDC